MPRLVTGTGSYLPGGRIPNEALEGNVANFDRERAGCDLSAWIVRHYGVEARHWAPDGESTGDIATMAARRALKLADLHPSDIELIVLATATSDHVTPPSAAVVQEQLECSAVFHEVRDACAGFVNALMIADSLMGSLRYRRALVISAEKTTHVIDRSDFRSAGLFGDGGGAVVLEDLPAEPEYGFQAFYAGSDGRTGNAIRVPAGGSRRPLTVERLAGGEHHLVCDYEEVLPFATNALRRCVTEILERTEIEAYQVDRVLASHGGPKALDEALRKAGIEEHQLFGTLAHTGNTSGATIPIALDELNRRSGLRNGDKLLLAAVGGGMSWASTLYVWADGQTLARARHRRRG